MKKLEKITKKWWFFALLLVLQFVVLPFSTKNFAFDRIGELIGVTLRNAFQVKMVDYYLYFQLLSIAVLISLFVLKNKVQKIFGFYVAISYIAFAILQNMAVTEKYDLSIVTINVLMFLFVAYVWVREFLTPQNDYLFSNINWKNAWMILLSLVAFWVPLDRGGNFDFSLSHFLYSGSSLGFCMMTPVFLTIMSFNIPKINIVTYRITAIIGIIIGFYNMLNFQNPHTANVAIVHLPLVIISIYATVKSYRINKNE